MSLSSAGFNATVYLQLASVLGVLSGGFLADTLTKRKPKPGNGRILTQSIGLLCGVPFLFLIGYARTLPILLISLLVFGYCKGIYDSNIFASLYDFVSVEYRGVAAGLLNSLGWLGGGTAPVLIAVVSLHYGMRASMSGTAAIYLAIGVMLFFAARRAAA
jgi:sugar phosphate permease